MSFDATFKKPAWDTLDPGQSVSGSISQSYNNFAGIQAQIAVTTNKLTAEKYDGGQLNQNGAGSAGFLGQAVRSAAVTAGASMLIGPAAGAVTGMITAGRDAAGFMTSRAPQANDPANQYYSLNRPLDVRTPNGYDSASEYTDGGTGDNYTDFSGQNYRYGFAMPHGPQPISAMPPPSPFMFRRARETDSAELRNIEHELATLVGKWDENNEQGLTAASQARTMNIKGPDTYVAQGYKPPVGPAFTV